MECIVVETHKRVEFAPVTRQVQERVRSAGVESGAALVFVPHTTAGITINENADPDVVHDLILAATRAFPSHPEFEHSEGNSDAHFRASMMGSSVLVPIEGGRLALGTWQGIFLCEFDGPRRRQVFVSCLAAAIPNR